MKSLKLLKSGKAVIGTGLCMYLGHTIYQQNGQFNLNDFTLTRVSRAAMTITSIGFDYKLNLPSSNSPIYGTQEYRDLKKQAHQRSANKLLNLCQKNGGCYIKVGQHISALKDLVPEEYCSTLKLLQNQVPEMNIDDIYKVLKEDLGQDPKEIFEDFDEKPLGTASLAQVHKAKLKENGDIVAIKVQHKDVKKHSEIDIKTMDTCVKIIGYVFPQFEFMWLARETRKNLPEELDFRIEGRNSEEAANLYSYFDWLRIPKVYWKWSTSRVLIMEYCNGKPINNTEYLKENGISEPDVEEKFRKLIADMIFKQGFVHCDPHPGNVLVSKNETSNKTELILLDHGLYRTLENDFRLTFAQFLLSCETNDLKGMESNAKQFGVDDYKLLASMVTGSSWETKNGRNRLDKSKKTDLDRKSVSKKAVKHIPGIIKILEKSDPQFPLIFKTIQLSSLDREQVARAVMKAIRTEQMKNSFRINCYITDQWDQLCISVKFSKSYIFSLIRSLCEVTGYL